MIDSLELSQISIVGPIRRCMKPGSLPAHIAQCVYCTEWAITFLGSPYPQLLFDINIALVQTRYHGDPLRRSLPNFHCRPYTACMKPGSLPARIAQCVYCADMAITFLGSPYPQLPFERNIALVQTRYRGDQQPRTLPNFHCRPYPAVYEAG